MKIDLRKWFQKGLADRAESDIRELLNILDENPVNPNPIELTLGKDHWRVSSRGLRFTWDGAPGVLVQVATDGVEMILHMIVEKDLAAKILRLIKEGRRGHEIQN